MFCGFPWCKKSDPIQSSQTSRATINKYYIIVLSHYQDTFVDKNVYKLRSDAELNIIRVRRNYIQDWLNKYSSDPNHSLNDIYNKENELLNDTYFNIRIFELELN